MFNGGVEMLSFYMRCSTDESRCRDAIVVHEMFKGGVEMLSFYMRCSTDESRWSRDGIVVHEMFNGGVEMLSVLKLQALTWKDKGPSTPLSDSPRPSRNAECSNCKLLLGKIKVLEATIEMYMHPEQHTLNSTTLLHEVCNDMGKLGLE
ncbi:hypothetical protein Tco_0475763 [Tanacetum coccineum]